MSVNTVRRAVRAILIGAFAVISSALFMTPAVADSSAYLRLAHLSPNTPEVDVYVASVADPTAWMVVLRGVGYGALSDYQVLPSGSYVVSMRPAGAAETTPAVISATLEATTGAAYTVAGVGMFEDLGLTVLTDDLTLPASGKARARVIQAAASAPEVDIAVIGGASLGEGVDFATTTSYSEVLPGEWTLRVSAESETLAELPVTVDAGSVYSVLILDTPTGLSLALHMDASASGVVPVGGVESGAGGTAIVGTGSPLVPVALTLVALIGLVGLTLRRDAGRMNQAGV